MLFPSLFQPVQTPPDLVSYFPERETFSLSENSEGPVEHREFLPPSNGYDKINICSVIEPLNWHAAPSESLFIDRD
jgi:hypothetical protein